MLRFIIADKSGELGVTLMHDLAQHMLRCTTNEITTMLQQVCHVYLVINQTFIDYIHICSLTNLISFFHNLQSNGKEKVFNRIVKVFGLKSYSWFLKPPKMALNAHYFHTIEYIFEVDWCDECMLLFKKIT